MSNNNFNLLTVLKSDATQFIKGFNKAKGSLNSFSRDGKKGLGGITSFAKKAVPALAAIGGITSLASLGKDAVELAGKLEGVQAAFSRINNASLLNDLRTATKGTVDDMKLMQYAVQAKNFKIPLDQLATYFKFATNRAAETGESVDYLVNSLITGLGRKSVLVMDNLGISALELSQKTKEVGDFGKAAGIIMQEELAKAGDVAKTTGQRFDEWKAKFTNIKVNVGKQLMPVVNQLMDGLMNNLPKIINYFNSWVNGGIDLYNEFVDLYNKSESFRIVIESIKGAFKVLWNVATATLSAIGKSLTFIKDLVISIFDPDVSSKEIWQGFKNELVVLGKDVENAALKIGEDFVDNVKNGTAKKAHKKVQITDIIDTSNLGNDSLASIPVNVEVVDIDKDINKDLEKEFSNLGKDLKVEKLVEASEIVATSWQEMQSKIANNTISNTLSQLQNEFIQFAETGEFSFKNMVGGILSSLNGLIMGLLAQSIAQHIANAMSPNPQNIATGGIWGLATAAVGTTALMAMFAKLPQFATGGIVGGNSYTGDKQLIRVNSKEMILNTGQQANLFKMLNNGFGGMGNIDWRIKGTDLIGVLTNTNRKALNMR